MTPWGWGVGPRSPTYLETDLPQGQVPRHRPTCPVATQASGEAPFVSHCSVTKSTLYFADSVAALSLKPGLSSQNSCEPLHDMLKFCIAVRLLALLPNPLLEDNLVLVVHDIIWYIHTVRYIWRASLHLHSEDAPYLNP
jgi:hypothetical protein